MQSPCFLKGVMSRVEVESGLQSLVRAPEEISQQHTLHDRSHLKNTSHPS